MKFHAILFGKIPVSSKKLDIYSSRKYLWRTEVMSLFDLSKGGISLVVKICKLIAWKRILFKLGSHGKSYTVKKKYNLFFSNAWRGKSQTYYMYTLSQISDCVNVFRPWMYLTVKCCYYSILGIILLLTKIFLTPGACV